MTETRDRFPLSNQDEIVYRNGEIGTVGSCVVCGAFVIQAQWPNHTTWHAALKESMYSAIRGHVEDEPHLYPDGSRS